MDPLAHPHRPHRRPGLLPLTPPGAQPLALPDAAGYYLANFLPAPQADALLARLHATLAWQVHVLTLFGRRVAAPRRCAWYGDAGARYGYSGLALDPQPWTPELARLRALLEAVTGAPYNSVLANLYRDGRDRMGWHADDEAELGPEPVIASLSLGAARRFLLRHRTRRDVPAHALALAHGSLLVLAGPTQRCWRHALPAARRVRAPRINLTFRQVSPRPTTMAGAFPHPRSVSHGQG